MLVEPLFLTNPGEEELASSAPSDIERLASGSPGRPEPTTWPACRRPGAGDERRPHGLHRHPDAAPARARRRRPAPLDADASPDAAERNAAFKALETELTRAGRGGSLALRAASRRAPALSELEADARRLRVATLGFVQVVTPTIITATPCERMGIDAGHPLAEQVFWLEGERCLRPMLAPNLYTLWRRLARVWPLPFGIFEIGSCFRMDTKGSQASQRVHDDEPGRAGHAARRAARARLAELAPA